MQSKKPGAAAAKGSRRLVKCLVCGEIFDSSIEICPVCGVGRENFVPVEDAANDFTNNTANDYLILGNGAAGFNAAKAIRERDATGRIIMVSEEPYPSYNRPMLTKSLVAGLEPEQIAMVDAPWYEENQVHQMPGKRVESVDTDARQALLDDGTKLRFTKLIYALGSECFIPPMEGSRLPEVAAIRRLSDVRRVETLMKSTGKAVVIGGGVLGLEAAWELKKAGLEVTVLEMAPSLMGRQLDESSGEQLKIIASKAGVVIRSGVNGEAIEGAGHVSGVRLKTGEVVEAGMVIVSAGIRANIELAKKMGLETKKGVVVNERMETSVSGIYACGDCAQYHDGNYGIWPEAVEQGKTAGANAAGDSLEYMPVPAALTFHGMNTALFAAGDNGRNPNLYYKTVEFRDMGKEQYRKYYFLNNRMSGVILMGDLSRMAAMTEALENHATYQEVMEN